MSTQPLLEPGQLARLLAGKSISARAPWSTDDEAQVDAFYAEACREIERETGALSKIEWKHYGSGYASFVDAWFYEPTPGFAPAQRVRTGEGYVGLALLLCRLSPHYVMLEGEKHWHAKGSSGYLPASEGVDELRHAGPKALAARIEPLLERRGLARLRRGDLATPLPEGTRVPTILQDGDFTEFDALFHWED